MASVYRSMNFHRKAALFTHYAARVASNIATTDQEVYKVRTIYTPPSVAYVMPSSIPSPFSYFAPPHTHTHRHTTCFENACLAISFLSTLKSPALVLVSTFISFWHLAEIYCT